MQNHLCQSPRGRGVGEFVCKKWGVTKKGVATVKKNRTHRRLKEELTYRGKKEKREVEDDLSMFPHDLNS